MTTLKHPYTTWIHVQETIPLKHEYANRTDALVAAQAYDNAADDNAHSADGYLDHAQFFFQPAAADSPSKLIVQYVWRDAESLERLLAKEISILGPWFERYAVAPREVIVLEKLPVDI